MDPKENLRHSLDKLPSTEVDAQEEMITPVDGDNIAEIMLQDGRSDNIEEDIENLSVSNTSSENLRHSLDKLPSTEVDAQEEMITPVDGDNIAEIMLQDRRSDNIEEDIKNLSVSNAMQDKEYINSDNNIVNVTENPRVQTSSKNRFRDNNCSSKTSYLILDNQMKCQLEIATGGIAQNQLKNTNKIVETELLNRGKCRQRLIPSLNSNEEPQNGFNSLWEKVELLNTTINEETNSTVEDTIQRNIHSPVHQVYDGVRQIREIVLDELISEHQHFRQLLARDRPILEHVQINSSRESERQRRLRYYSIQAMILNFRVTQCRSVNRRITTMMNGFSNETRQITMKQDKARQIGSTEIREIRGLMNELADISERYRRNEDDPPAFDYSSAENAREIQLDNVSSVQVLLDKMHRYRMNIGEEIVREHLRLLHLFVRDLPFLDYMQINSSRVAEKQRRLRYYSNRGTIFSDMVVRCRSINRRLNRMMTLFYDGTREISLMAIIILKGLKRELERLSADNVRHEVELPAFDYPD